MALPTSTLLTYPLGDGVRAFSTSRLAPSGTKQACLAENADFGAFNVNGFCGDTPQHVEACRAWLCKALEIAPADLHLPHQTHTSCVKTIDDDFLKLPAVSRREFLENTDALVTNIPRQCIGISTADCMPILLYDASRHAVGAVHAGWRGTVKHIIRNAVAKMQQQYAVRPEELRVVIGPSISAENFEVGEEVVQAFLDAGFSPRIVRRAQGKKPHVDLWAAAVEELEACGIELQNVAIAGICTYQHADTFFSARRLSIHSGRIYTGIMLEA